MGTDDQHVDASWQADPFGRHDQRYWDGKRWSEKVRSGGTVGIDPPEIVPNPEHARDYVPARPITDASEPVEYTSTHVSRLLLLGVVLLVAIVVLVIVGVATA